MDLIKPALTVARSKLPAVCSILQKRKTQDSRKGTTHKIKGEPKRGAELPCGNSGAPEEGRDAKAEGWAWDL